MNVLEKVLDKIGAKQKAAGNAYLKIAREIGDGKEPTPEVVQKALFDSGKNTDDLRADVERYTKRLEDRATADTLLDIRKERDELAAKVKLAAEELEAAEQKHRDETAPLYHRMHVLNEQEKQAAQAEERLLETSPLHDSLNYVIGERRQVEARIQNAERNIAEMPAFLEKQKARTGDERWQQELKETVEKGEKTIADAQASLPGMKKKLADLRKQEAELERMARDPAAGLLDDGSHPTAPPPPQRRYGIT